LIEIPNNSRPKGSSQKGQPLRKLPIILSHRLARTSDIPAIMALMDAAIVHNMAAFLSRAEIEAARDSMGIDRSLIADQTYFIIETIIDDASVMVGCGGWGRRRTLYGGDETSGRDDRLSNPATEAARIRAMYTHPDWIRCGVALSCRRISNSKARKSRQLFGRRKRDHRYVEIDMIFVHPNGSTGQKKGLDMRGPSKTYQFIF